MFAKYLNNVIVLGGDIFSENRLFLFWLERVLQFCSIFYENQHKNYLNFFSKNNYSHVMLSTYSAVCCIFSYHSQFSSKEIKIFLQHFPDLSKKAIFKISFDRWYSGGGIRKMCETVWIIRNHLVTRKTVYIYSAQLSI